MTNKRADWMPWVLRFVSGAGEGVFAGLASGSSGRRWGWRSRWLESGFLPEFVLGCALIVACLGSLYGERLWTGLSDHVIPPVGIEHSPTSLVLSIPSGIVGAALITKTFLLTFGVR